MTSVNIEQNSCSNLTTNLFLELRLLLGRSFHWDDRCCQKLSQLSLVDCSDPLQQDYRNKGETFVGASSEVGDPVPHSHIQGTEMSFEESLR